MFPTLAQIVSHWKELNLFKKKTLFLLHAAFKETASACDIYGKLPYQCMCSLHYQWLSETKQSTQKPHRDAFSFSFGFLFCLLFSLRLFLLVLFYFGFCETQRNVPEFVSCWIVYTVIDFPCSGPQANTGEISPPQQCMQVNAWIG